MTRPAIAQSTIGPMLQRYQQEISSVSQELLKLRGEFSATLASLESRLDSLQLELEQLRSAIISLEISQAESLQKVSDLGTEGFFSESPKTGPGSLPPTLRLNSEPVAKPSLVRALKNQQLRRRYYRWPSLLFLFLGNLIVTSVVIVWEHKHQTKVFPGT